MAKILISRNISPQKLLHRFSSTKSSLRKTVLHDFHEKAGGKMVPFAGFSMPVQYKTSIIEEHNHVRSAAGLFDVSHMVQSRVCGIHRQEVMEHLTVADISHLKETQGTLSLLLNDNGGILDDLIITKCAEPHLYMVSNAGTAEKVLTHLNYYFDKFNSQGKDVRIELVDAGLLALQGPKAAQVLQSAVGIDLSNLKFMHGVYEKVFGVAGCRITRCGYTGEDGFELSIPLEKTEEVAKKLLDNSDVLPIGLGARDTLRLEAGLCLYGNDIDEERTPIEAGLAWTISKFRRSEGGFKGQEKVLGQLRKEIPVEKRRAGFVSSTGPPPRSGAKIYKGDSEIGVITSGCRSPLTNLNISMGYVESGNTKSGTELICEVRGKRFPIITRKMPFVPAKYYTG